MIKLLFYNADLSAWPDYVMAIDYLKIERQSGLDEMQVVSSGDGLEFRLIDAFCCHVIANNDLSMWVIDRKTIKVEKSDITVVSFTIYEPLWLLNTRVANRQIFTSTGLAAFTTSVITNNTSGDRSLGTINTTALSSLPGTYQVTRTADGEKLADMLLEEYIDRSLKLYLTMSVANGLVLTAGVQQTSVSESIMLSPLLQNMKINMASVTNEFNAVYVSGEYQVSGEDPVLLRGYYSYGNTDVYREEHFTQSEKSSDGMTQARYQTYLNSQARRIAKRRTISVDISTTEDIIKSISAEKRYNRAGVVFTVNINNKVVKYIIDEVKTTPRDISIGVNEYKG